MDLSIIIVNWNSVTYLQECLSSIFRTVHGLQYEVILIDNASYDGSARLVQDNYPGVIFLQNRENMGFARANNLAYRHTSGDYLLFLNPDTELLDNAIATMLRHLAADRHAGILGPRLLNTDRSLQTSCVQSFPTILNQVLDSELLRRAFPMWRLWGMRALYSRGAEPAAVDAVAGACMMVKRSVFERIGLFTEAYFMYLDDLDLCYKARQAGYTTLYADACVVIHHGKKSSDKQHDNFSTIWQRRSLNQFFRTTRGPVYSVTYRLAMACAAVLRIALAPLVLVVGRAGRAHRNPLTIIRKWGSVFRWAVGFDSYAVLDPKRDCRS